MGAASHPGGFRSSGTVDRGVRVTLGYGLQVGLIDRLAERVLDEASASRRAASSQRQELRKRLLADLGRYSEDIEGMRLAYLRAHDSIALGSEISFALREDVSELASDLLPGYGPPYEREAELTELGLAPTVVEQLSDYFRAQARATLSDWLDESGSIEAQTTAATERATLLDDAWVSLRPQLDDALEIEAVSYLREFRHALRRQVQTTNTLLWLHLRTPPPRPPSLTAEVVEQIEHLLVLADSWNANVGGVRNQI